MNQHVISKRASALASAAVLALAAQLLAGCGRRPADTGAAAPPPALVQRVSPMPAAGAEFFSGDIRARHETDMAFRIGGKIVAREVEVGASVKPGSVLARLDPADVGAQLAQSEAQFALAEADVRRYRDLRAKNFISQSALDAKESAFRAARAQLDLARNQSAYAVLRADRAGVVTMVNAEPGQVVAPGQTVARLARPDELEVAINVPEGRLRGFQSAERLYVTLWSAPGKRYAARIRELSPMADAATRTFAARVSVLGADSDVRLGMTANVGIDTGRGQIFALPQPALTRVDGKPVVWVVDPNAQTVAPRAVTLAEFAVDDKVIIADGLSPGELVVTAGVHKLLAGQKVRPIPVAAEK